MNPDPRFEEAVDGSLPEPDWQDLAADPAMRQALAEQLSMDAALRVMLEEKEIALALKDSIIASTKTAEVSHLAARIIASTRREMPKRKRMRRLWPNHSFEAAAAVLILCCIIGVWAINRQQDGPKTPQTETKPVAANTESPKPALADIPAPKSIPSEPAPQEVVVVKPPQTPEVPNPGPTVMTERPKEEAPQPKDIETPVAQLVALSAPARTMPLVEEVHASAPAMPSADERIQFEKHILPLFERSCFECHSAKLKKPKGDVRLDDLAAIRTKSKTDSLIFPHKPGKSALLHAISLARNDDGAMPPAGKGQPLSNGEIAIVKRWIEEGASFGNWTSAKAKSVVVHTSTEAIEAANVKKVAGRIDELIAADLKLHGEPSGEPADDHTFLRRVYLDLIGRIPSYTELQKFLHDKSNDKRPRLIDELLASNGYTSYMFNYWADLLRAKEVLADDIDGKPYLLYIKQSVLANKHFDAWARELLSPEGFGWKAPATGYYLRDGANRPANIEATATLFLGTQISCAQCHDHPYDQWTRMDYHQFLAFTSGIKASNDDSDVGTVSKEMIKRMENRYDNLAKYNLNNDRKAKYNALAAKVKSLQATAGGAGVVNSDTITSMVPADYQYKDAKPGEAIEPKVLFGEGSAPLAKRPADSLAEWVTSPQNPRFNLALANRLWAKLFGLPFAGKVDQVKDIADCDNPDLAAYLANVVRESQYDVRQILRIFSNTQAYQARAHMRPEPGNSYCFPSPVVRRLSAEQVWDSMMTLAVKDLDKQIDLEPPNTARIAEATKATRSSDISRIANQMVNEEQRKTEALAKKNRKFGELAVEFAGGGFMRASELPQPAPLGHFLRMFGQGNRDFIGDGWSAPTVPQSLLMLNSQFFDKVARSGSPLAESMKGATNAKDVVCHTFLAVLTREPTSAEITAVLECTGETHNPKSLAKTLLTTAEFVFQK